MNLKLQPMEVDQDDPFKGDLLNRKGEVENLTALLIAMNSPAVLAVDSRWGTGKTTFIKMWEQHLNKVGVPSLYFNAWETDFSADPLVSFLGEINEGLKTLIGVSKESGDSWSKAKEAGKQIAKRGIPALIKIGTAGVIDTNELIENEISGVLGDLASDSLDEYLKQKAAIAEFHDSLESFISLSSKSNPVVIFVDELDRCRPTYAIALLERIKHLFNIKGLVFVLALDKDQLGHSIKSVYGDGIDSSGYLRRFIDFEYHLSEPQKEEYIESLFGALSINEFFEPRKLYDDLRYDRDHLKGALSMLAKSCSLSLREIEQLTASINIAIRTAKENEYIHPALLAFLVFTKNFKPELYKKYVRKNGSESDLIGYLCEIGTKESRKDVFQCAVIEGLLIAAKQDGYATESGSLSRHKSVIGDDESPDLEKQYSATVLKVVNRPAGFGHGVDLDVLVQRIDWLSQFQF